ncbi:MAG: hypothetical protein MK207_15835 [Saprospiraceae bacterium]|nr:hypothetical protein [Saprospiraceae bacterium]
MSKQNLYYNYVLSILSVLIMISVNSCHHDKQSDVAYYADVGCSDLIFMSEQNINWINNYLIPDTIEVEVKNGYYRNMKRDGLTIKGNISFISLVTSLYTNDKNKIAVRKISNELKGTIFKIYEFYINHPTYSAFKTRDLDTLTSYYNSLISNINQLKKIKIEP